MSQVHFVAQLVGSEQIAPAAAQYAQIGHICRLQAEVLVGHAVGAPNKTGKAVATDVASQIRVVRGQRVLLDSDLAALYAVPTHRLNEAMKRNAARFPADFEFRLTADEQSALISQAAISKPGRGGRRKPASAGNG